METAEKSEVVEEGVETIEDAIEADKELETDDVILEGEELEEGEVAELEEWEKTGEEEETLPDVPVATHIKAKDKWKRQKATINTELEAAKAEIESLKAGANRTASTKLERPDEDDFETAEEFEEAKEQYLIKRIRIEDQQKDTEAKNKAFNDSISDGVEVHYGRVDKFVAEKKINPDVYKTRESVFVAAIEEANPGMGEANADFYLSKLGIGSEKIPYFLGGNKAKLAEFKELLKNDHTGISVAMFLGEENARLRGVNAGKPKSNAPKPASTATGDTATKVPANAGNLEKKYNDALKKGQDAKAFDIKYDAKRVHKIDTNKW